jgi:N-acetyl-anhydromuramyl-L-alanine amidase AmpD
VYVAEVDRRAPSPNHDDRAIAVEFLLLHYTAGTLEDTLAHLAEPAAKVSSHLVVGTSGEIVEVVPCWDGVALRAWHAGASRWVVDRRRWEGFNDLAIGVELVNPNGNLLAYTTAQYRALRKIVRHLRRRYPALRDPERVLGHEHVASFRGKVDPGHCFDWPRFYRLTYPEDPPPRRPPACPARLRDVLMPMLHAVPEDTAARRRYWHGLSALLETATALIHEATAKTEPWWET